MYYGGVCGLCFYRCFQTFPLGMITIKGGNWVDGWQSVELLTRLVGSVWNFSLRFDMEDVIIKTIKSCSFVQAIC